MFPLLQASAQLTKIMIKLIGRVVGFAHFMAAATVRAIYQNNDHPKGGRTQKTIGIIETPKPRTHPTTRVKECFRCQLEIVLFKVNATTVPYSPPSKLQ